MSLGSTVAELQGRMSSREFAEWVAYYQISPFGDERADLRAGIVAATVANSSRESNTRAYEPVEFIPRFTEQKPDPARLLEKFKALLPIAED